jgi:DedD protein
MEQYLKERLFGAAILIALGVIFLPILFEEKITSSTEKKESMPMSNWAFSEDLTEEIQPEVSKNSADFTTVFEQLRQEEIKQNLAQEKIAVAALKTGSDAIIKESPKEISKETIKEVIKEEIKAPVLAAAIAVPVHAETKIAPVVALSQTAAVVPTPVTVASEVSPTNKQVWSIQLGSFSNSANAEQLVKTLKKSGFKAYAEQSTGRQGAYMKVLVGPEFDEKNATSMVSTLEKRFKLKGMLVRYQPGVL